jgi:hypothetical protein
LMEKPEEFKCVSGGILCTAEIVSVERQTHKKACTKLNQIEYRRSTVRYQKDVYRRCLKCWVHAL